MADAVHGPPWNQSINQHSTDHQTSNYYDLLTESLPYSCKAPGSFAKISTGNRAIRRSTIPVRRSGRVPTGMAMASPAADANNSQHGRVKLSGLAFCSHIPSCRGPPWQFAERSSHQYSPAPSDCASTTKATTRGEERAWAAPRRQEWRRGNLGSEPVEEGEKADAGVGGSRRTGAGRNGASSVEALMSVHPHTLQDVWTLPGVFIAWPVSQPSHNIRVSLSLNGQGNFVLERLAPSKPPQLFSPLL